MKVVCLLFAVALMAMFGKTQALPVSLIVLDKEPLYDNEKLLRALHFSIYNFRQQSKDDSDFDYVKITKAEIQRTQIGQGGLALLGDDYVFLSGSFRETTDGKLKKMTCSFEVVLESAGEDRVRSYQCNSG